jgi:hypothetical protein
MTGDVDSDGCDDIVVGGPQDPVANANSGSTSGPGYVFLIPASEVASGCSGSAEYAYYYGEDDGDAAGYSVDFVDYNGDGDSEILIGAPLADSEAGAVYVAEGDEVGLVDLGSDMVTYTGESGSDRAGWSVANAGDFNDDGYEDVIIGAYGNDDGANNAGSVYLILGPRSISETEIDLDTSDVQITGTSNGDGAGYDVASAGDVNDDGYGDLLIGAWKDDDGANNAGTTFVLLGGPVSFSTFALSSADAIFSGNANGDLSGAVLAGGQDVNDDGLDDILIGAYYADDGGNHSGAAYLILGLGQ